MVYNENTFAVDRDICLEYRNIPFEGIDLDLIEEFGIDVEKFKTTIPFMNRSHWNISLVNGVMIAVAWGVIFPIEGIMVVHRLGIRKQYRTIDLLHEFVDRLLQFGEDMGAMKALFLSDRADAWIRLLHPKCELADTKVIERIIE